MHRKLLGFVVCLGLAYGVNALAGRGAPAGGDPDLDAPTGKGPAWERHGLAREALLARMTEHAQTPAFRGAVDMLATETGKRPVPLSSRHAPGAAYTFSHDDPDELRRTLKWPVREKGAMLLRYGWSDVALFATADPLDVVVFLGIGPSAPIDGRDVTPLDVTDALRALHSEQPFELTGFSRRGLYGHFVVRVKDPDAVTRRLAAVCPEPDADDPWGFTGARARGSRLALHWD